MGGGGLKRALAFGNFQIVGGRDGAKMSECATPSPSNMHAAGVTQAWRGFCTRNILRGAQGILR